MPRNTSFVFPDEADPDSAKAMSEAMAKLPNHISHLLNGINDKNWKKYISAKWDDFEINGKPTAKLNLFIHDHKTGEIVPSFIQGPFRLASSFGRLTGNEESCITTDEQAAILDRKKAEDRQKYVSSTINDAKNKITLRSFFNEGNGEKDPTFEALKLLEKYGHLIISEKCKEQVNGKGKIKRINELDAENIAGKPENILKLGKKYHKLFHEWVWESNHYMQLAINRNATKKAKADEVIGLVPKVYENKFDPKATKENPNPQKRIPFPFPFKVLCQEVEDNSDDEDEDPKIRAEKETITVPDPSGNGSKMKVEVTKYNNRSLVNYRPRKGNTQDLATITKNDTLRGEICTGKYGIPIATIECSQGKYGGFFSLKLSDLSWGVRPGGAFGVTLEVKGFIKMDREEEEDTEAVNLALQFTRKATSKPSASLKTIMEENDEEVPSDDDAIAGKRKRSLDNIDEEPEEYREKQKNKKTKKTLSDDRVSSSEDEELSE